MKSAVETLSPTRAKLTVEVPFEELKPSLDKAYKTIAQQINIPGFRRGKVPPMVIDRQVGRGAILDQAINEALPQFYIQALQDNDLQPLAPAPVELVHSGLGDLGDDGHMLVQRQVRKARELAPLLVPARIVVEEIADRVQAEVFGHHLRGVAAEDLLE